MLGVLVNDVGILLNSVILTMAGAVNGEFTVVALSLMMLVASMDLALCNRLNSARQDGGFGFPEEPEEDMGKRNEQVKVRGVPKFVLHKRMS